ncbi:MAG: DinB family protein [Dehalococcoidia bacterium]
MAETTASGLRADIATAFGDYTAELKLAGPHWERKPAASTGGEDGWSARQVAEHIAGASGFFAGGIAKAAGLQAGAPSQPSFADVDAALAATPGAHAGLMSVVDKVQDSQLGAEMEFGPLGKTTLGQVIGVVAYHLNDHAKQLKSLRGA